MAAATQAIFYVSPAGNDANAGSISAPFLTIGAAQTAVRALAPSMTGDIIVYLRGGTYPLAAPLAFGPADSGTNGFHVFYQAYNNEVPVISGGVPVKGWTLVSGNVYSAPLSRTTKLRSLFVNGVRAFMTKSPQPIQGSGNAGTFTVQGTEPWVLGGASGVLPDDVQFSPTAIGFYPSTNPGDLELVQNYTFNSTIVSVRGVQVTSSYYVDLQLQQPYGALAASMQFTTGLNPGGAFQVQNAYELLNSPGQFYFNRVTGTLYYYSRGENMATAQVIAPTTEGLITIHGASNTNRVSNLEFIGLTFAYDHWQMYNVAGSTGMGATQSVAGQVRYAGSQGWYGVQWNDTQTPQASIDVQNANGIVFQGDAFQHLSSGTAVGFTDDVINSSVTGNSFVDLAGNAVNVGNQQNAYPNVSVLYPPSLWGVCTNDTVQDNYVRLPNQMYYQFEGISAAYVNGLELLHNDISNTGYGAITLGWGWGTTNNSTSPGNNRVDYNRINASNQILNADGGSIYNLGAEPNSSISYNYISNGLTALYTDAGSEYLDITYNVIANQGWLYIPNTTAETNLFVDNNYTNTNIFINNSVPSANNTVSNTHLETTFDPNAQAIIANSGLEPQYRYLQNAPVVSGLTANISNGQAVLNWQSSGIATSFNIYRATSPGAEGTTPYQPGVSGSTFIDTSIASGVTYYYKVTAVGLAGETAPSNEAVGTSAVSFNLSVAPSALTVEAGGSSSSQIAVASINGFAASVSLTASGLPSGVTANLTANNSGCTLTLTATSSAALGAYTITLTGTGGSPAITISLNVPLTVTPSYNASAIYSNGVAVPASGGFDGSGDAYSADLLGTSVTWNGIVFPLGPANAPNAVANATVPLPAGKYSVLSLLGAASYGSQSGTLVVTYSDGTTTSFTQTFSDWTQTNPIVTQPGESLALAMNYFNTGSKSTYNPGFSYNLYGYSFALNPAKTLQSITLPNNSLIKVLSIVPLAATSVNLSSAYSVYAAFTNGTQVSNGGFDGTGHSYSANSLGTSITWNAINFPLGPANAPDAAAVTTIALPAGNFNTISLLGASSSGNTAGTLFVTYADGTTSSFNQTFSQWTQATPFTNQPGESIALATGVFNVGTSTDAPSAFAADVYGYSFPLNAGKTVASVTLPANSAIKVFSINLLGAASVAATTPPTPQSQTITFNPIPAQVVGGTLTVSATASSGLPVAFSVVPNGNCSVSGSVVTFLNVGNCGVVASQAGNSSYAAAPAVGQIIVVNNPQPQTISFAAPANQAPGTTETLSATASSGLSVSFASTTSAICTVSGSTASLLAAGTCTIVASQAGNNVYGAATPVTRSFTVTSAASVTATVAPATLANGNYNAFSVSLSGFSAAPTTLGLSGVSCVNIPGCTVNLGGSSGLLNFEFGFVTSTTASLDVYVSNTILPGTYAIPITLGTTTIGTFNLTVPGAAAFTISTNSSFTLARGTGGTLPVTITPASGFSGSVSLSLTGLPTGASDTFLTNSATSSTLVIYVPGTVTAGTYTLTINGSSASASASTTVQFVVQ